MTHCFRSPADARHTMSQRGHCRDPSLVKPVALNPGLAQNQPYRTFGARLLIFGETHHPTERSPLLTYESAKSGGDRETGCPEGRAAKFGHWGAPRWSGSIVDAQPPRWAGTAAVR